MRLMPPMPIDPASVLSGRCLLRSILLHFRCPLRHLPITNGISLAGTGLDGWHVAAAVYGVSHCVSEMAVVRRRRRVPDRRRQHDWRHR